MQHNLPNDGEGLKQKHRKHLHLLVRVPQNARRQLPLAQQQQALHLHPSLLDQVPSRANHQRVPLLQGVCPGVQPAWLDQAHPVRRPLHLQRLQVPLHQAKVLQVATCDLLLHALGKAIWIRKGHLDLAFQILVSCSCSFLLVGFWQKHARNSSTPPTPIVIPSYTRSPDGLCLVCTGRRALRQ